MASGRGSIENKMDHPVTCIATVTFLLIVNGRCPPASLEEWEIACRAGSENDIFFENDKEKIKKYATYVLKKPLIADSSDGFMILHRWPAFHPIMGLYDMYGNVFDFVREKLKNKESKHCPCPGRLLVGSSNAVFFNHTISAREYSCFILATRDSGL